MNDADRTRQIVDELARVDGDRPGAKSPSVKHALMAQNPFRFLRGSAQLFYHDLANGLVTLPLPFVNTARQTTVLGDCHMANFGFVTEKGSYGKHIVFGPNDFDEACIGSAGWDLTRFITSLYVGADFACGFNEGHYVEDGTRRHHDLKVPRPEDVTKAAQAFLTRYAAVCLEIVDDRTVRRRTLDSFGKHHPLRHFLKKARKRAIGGKNFETKSSLGKAVAIRGAGLQFKNDPERYLRLDPATERSVREAFRPYVDDEVLDVVRRLGQGTGSIDMPRYYLLVGPRGASTHAELPMCQIVEVKQQRAAAALHNFPSVDPRNCVGPAHLTVNVQRRVQREPDLLLDHAEWDGAYWLIRSRHHARVTARPEQIFLSKGGGAKRLKKYAEACGEALALAHSRGDSRSVRFEISIAAAFCQDGDALVETACAYAALTIEDWRRFRTFVLLT
ncbi:DUF2252 family protein [Sphingomonas sp. H160509]|uniref:DUF2252 family protein n=1 Tax=Sphingomonas sp. H160509 TaxID=2955313 RepID=UPI0020978DA0|nr:DUF2252 family protein [Sphingomonas sp. H160509]MDD1449873.1 DUF2252 family protein [Sphingomonas sp. H160509]